MANNLELRDFLSNSRFRVVEIAAGELLLGKHENVTCENVYDLVFQFYLGDTTSVSRRYLLRRISPVYPNFQSTDVSCVREFDDGRIQIKAPKESSPDINYHASPEYVAQ